MTFITAQEFLRRGRNRVGGYMAVALVLMESPAIIVAVLLSTFVRNNQRQLAVVGGAANPARMKMPARRSSCSN